MPLRRWDLLIWFLINNGLLKAWVLDFWSFDEANSQAACKPGRECCWPQRAAAALLNIASQRALFSLALSIMMLPLLLLSPFTSFSSSASQFHRMLQPWHRHFHPQLVTNIHRHTHPSRVFIQFCLYRFSSSRQLWRVQVCCFCWKFFLL
jgi:hypothetical protein